MSRQSRSLMIYGLLAATTHTLAFQAGRMTAPRAPRPVPAVIPTSIQADAKIIPQPLEAAQPEPEPIPKEPPPALPEKPAPIAVAPAPVANPAAVQNNLKTAPPVPTPDPEGVLRRKGLKRSGLVYVLQEEDAVYASFNVLNQVFVDWQAIVTEMNKHSVWIGQLQNALVDLERREHPKQPAFVPVFVPPPPPPDQGLETNRGARETEKKKESKDEAKKKTKEKSGSKSSDEDEMSDESAEPRGQPDQRPSYTPPNPYGYGGYSPGINSGPSAAQSFGHPIPGGGYQTVPPSHPHLPQTAPILQPFPYPPPNQTGPIVPHPSIFQPGPGSNMIQPSPPPQGTTSSNIQPHGPVSQPRRLNVVLPQILRAPKIPTTREGIHLQITDSLIALNHLKFLAEVKVGEFKRRQAALMLAMKDLQRSYDALGKDPAVLESLSELNKTANPKVTLGFREKYDVNLKKMTEKQLEVEGLQREGQRDFFSVAFVTTLDYRTRKAEDQLRVALATLESEEKQWQGQAGSRKKRHDKAIREGKQGGIADLQKEASYHEGRRMKFAREVNACREAYVQNVATLRKAVDEAPQKIAELKKTHPDIKISPIPKSVHTNLGRAEATITTEGVPLEADKNVNRVAVLIDGNPRSQMMVLDPGGDVIRMSADSAAALGINHAEAGITEVVTMKDGQKLTARRITLKSVQVGPFSAQDVECLVFLTGYEAPPSLGASFLDRFSYRVDADAGRLTLTRVELKPSSTVRLFKVPDRTAGALRTNR